ncbi:MAG: LON peptidase substrate-binding domain-containing protein, partial [Bacteroidota bacterium]
MDDSQRRNFEKNMYYDMISAESEIIPLFSDDEELDFNSVDVPEALPILPLKNAVLFPGIVMPITVGREKSIELVRDYNRKSKIIGTATQKNPQIEDPQVEDLYEVASIAQIVRILEMPDGNTTVILQGLGRVAIKEQLQNEPYLMCKTVARNDVKSPVDEEFNAILGTLKDMIFKIIKLSANIPKEITFAIKNITNPLFLINFIAANTDIALEQKLELLHVDIVKDRATLLMKFLAQQIQMLEIKNDILMKTRKDIDQQQRDFFLQQQIKQIQSELGDNSMEQEIQELRDKAQHKKWPDSIRLHFEKEVTKLARMNVQAAEHSVHYNYVQTLIELPWDEHTED